RAPPALPEEGVVVKVPGRSPCGALVVSEDSGRRVNDRVSCLPRPEAVVYVVPAEPHSFVEASEIVEHVAPRHHAGGRYRRAVPQTVAEAPVPEVQVRRRQTPDPKDYTLVLRLPVPVD